jgi:hypothetical protein
MAGFRQPLASVEYSDDEKFDRIMDQSKAGPDQPDYPPGLQFTISREDLGKFCEGDCAPGMTLRFAAMGTATSVMRDMDGCRIEVELGEMAGDDGKFVKMDSPPSVCLCGPEMEKIDLEEDCERGDMLHLIGTARVERTTSHEFGGDMVSLQIIELAVEDESEENRDG